MAVQRDGSAQYRMPPSLGYGRGQNFGAPMPPSTRRPRPSGAGGRAEQPETEDRAAMRIDAAGSGQHRALRLDANFAQPVHVGTSRARDGKLTEERRDSDRAGSEGARIHVAVTAGIQMAHEARLGPGFELRQQCGDCRSSDVIRNPARHEAGCLLCCCRHDNDSAVRNSAGPGTDLDAIHRLDQHLGSCVRNSLGQLAPVHAGAVGQLQFAVETHRAGRVKLAQPFDEQVRTPLIGNRPEQIQIRSSGQIRQTGRVLPKQSAEYARRYLDRLAKVEQRGEDRLPFHRRRIRRVAQRHRRQRGHGCVRREAECEAQLAMTRRQGQRRRNVI